MDHEVAAPLAPNGNGHKTLVGKLAEVMAAVERVPKRGHNDFHGYNYATEADIAATIRQELAQRHVMLVPSVESMERVPVGEKGSALTTLSMTFTFLDGDTGEELRRAWMGAGTDKEDKGLYKAMTGGEKYFLLKTFLMPTGDDPERDTEKKQERAPRRQPGEGGAEPQPDTAAEADAIFAAELPDDDAARALFEGGSRDCPACQAKGTIIRGKPEYGGGWVCWSRTKGKACGSKWPDKRGPLVAGGTTSPASPTATGSTTSDEEDTPYMVGAIIRRLNEAKATQAERQAIIRDLLNGKPVEAAAPEHVRKAFALVNDREAFNQWRTEFARQ